METPETHYARTPGGLHIAYKVIGDGPTDLLFLWQPPVAFDAAFEHPGHLRYWRFVSGFARVVGFDGRGLGASDPAPPSSFGSRHAWVEDALAVMDAIGIEQAVVQGEGFGGHAAIALATSHPERVRGLVLVNSFARLVSSDTYPHGAPLEQVDTFVTVAEAVWGSGQLVGSSVPLLGTEPTHRALLGRFERMSASPATAAACIRAMYESDVLDLIGEISVPTLVMYTGDLAFVTSDHSRFLADNIAGAQFIESEVQSFWGFDPSARNAVQEFVSGISEEQLSESELLALLFTDIVSSTDQLFQVGDAAWRQLTEDLDAYVRGEVARLRGRVIKHTGDGHLAVFPHPTDAIRCALRIRDAARVHEVEVRSGIHFGEVAIRSDGDVTGSAVNIAARVMAVATANQIAVSRTVVDLAIGAGVAFTELGEHQLKGVPGSWSLFAITS